MFLLFNFLKRDFDQHLGHVLNDYVTVMISSDFCLFLLNFIHQTTIRAILKITVKAEQLDFSGLTWPSCPWFFHVMLQLSCNQAAKELLIKQTNCNSHEERSHNGNHYISVVKLFVLHWFWNNISYWSGFVDKVSGFTWRVPWERLNTVDMTAIRNNWLVANQYFLRAESRRFLISSHRSVQLDYSFISL